MPLGVLKAFGMSVVVSACGFGGWPVPATFIETDGEYNNNSKIL